MSSEELFDNRRPDDLVIGKDTFPPDTYLRKKEFSRLKRVKFFAVTRDLDPQQAEQIGKARLRQRDRNIAASIDHEYVSSDWGKLTRKIYQWVQERRARRQKATFR